VQPAAYNLIATIGDAQQLVS